MTDNFNATAGDGTVVGASDLIGGVHYPRVKLIIGADGTNDGDVSGANPLPVDASGSTVDATGSVVGAAQSGSWAVSFTAPQHVIIDSATLGTVTVTGALTDTQLRATAVPISGAISFTAPQHTIVDSGTITAVTAITNALPAGSNVIGHVIVDSGTVTTVSTVTAVTSITNAVLVKGGTAADAALANAPVTIGGRATNTNLAEMSADGDVVDQQMTMQGALVTAHAPRELLGNTQTQLSASTSETTIIAAVSAVYNDLYGLVLANTGGTPTKVSIRDDTAGTVRAIVYVPAGETRGFMLPAASAMSQTATNKNWTAQCSAATTALEVTALFVKRK